MLKVVLIDDEKLALDVLMDLLSEHVTLEIIACYTNPIEAIEQCPIQDIDVVFLDIEMPGLNGIETASKLLAQNERLQIVFVSARINDLTEVSHIRHTDFLFKPVSRRQMAKTMKKIRKATYKMGEEDDKVSFLTVLGLRAVWRMPIAAHRLR